MRIKPIVLTLAICGTLSSQSYSTKNAKRVEPRSANADPLPCTYLIDTADLGIRGTEGGMEFTIITGSTCPWSISGLPPWLRVSGSAQGTGSAEVTLEADNNPGGLRVAVFMVAGVAVPIRQFDPSVCSAGTGCSLRPVPHVASGGEWTTALFAVNPTTHAADWSATFYDDNGSPIALPFTGRVGNVSTLTSSIPALGRIDYEAGNASLAVQGSWGLITTDIATTTQALFRRAVANGIYYEAAVPTSDGYNEFVIPFDATTFLPTGAPLYTGFAIANLNPSGAAHIVCTARDQSGTVIPNAVTIPSLNPLGHYAGYSFPVLTGKRGTLDCSADTLVSAIALRVIGTEAFSTLPVIVNDP
ncbi:MAG: hypothetical protein LAP61_26010 [Acidobacteriia bacterium]|nr:hypothetical protein [Terriglobia bacterium]